MARLYSGKRGKAGSVVPPVENTQEWVEMSPAEVEDLVEKLYREGYSPSQIGAMLRDSYGIGDVKKITGKKIKEILTERKLYPKIPEDLQNLIKKYIKVREHFSINRKDMTAKRGMQLTISKIKRLVKYYKRKKVLPEDWKFSPDKAELLVK